jgi:hypothetical protein
MVSTIKKILSAIRNHIFRNPIEEEKRETEKELLRERLK